jgi:hypothetical protein
MQSTNAFESLPNFLDSSFFMALVTLIVGSVALFIYFFQKRDKKREAANILILEIKQAENALRSFMDIGAVNQETIILPNNGWQTYHHLFINDLSPEERGLLTRFYTSCETMETALRRMKNYWVLGNEERIRITQQHLYNAKEVSEATIKELDGENHFWGNSVYYAPNFDKTILADITSRMEHIINTPCWTKLEKIAKKSWLQRFKNG